MEDTLNISHIYKKLRKIPEYLIIEIILLIILINCIFSHIYFSIYRNDNNSFKNVHTSTKLEKFDFFYFANTTFFSLGYDIIPISKKARIMCMIQLLIGFILTSIMIARIIN
jgi:hypothetical protein